MTITPKLIVSSTAQAIGFYRSAFAAEEIERYTLDSGQVVHATIRIGESVLALADEAPDWGNPTPTSAPAPIHVQRLTERHLGRRAAGGLVGEV